MVEKKRTSPTVVRKDKEQGAVVPYEFIIEEKDVLERAHFGSFEIVKTRRGIMYKNYAGFHVWAEPYVTRVDGGMKETSLYEWLDNAIAHKKLSTGHEGEPYGDGSVTRGDVLDMVSILTESNVTYPMTAFVDLDRATEFATRHMRWLKEMQEKLRDAMASAPPGENACADAADKAAVDAAGTLNDALGSDGGTA